MRQRFRSYVNIKNIQPTPTHLKKKKIHVTLFFFLFPIKLVVRRL